MTTIWAGAWGKVAAKQGRGPFLESSARAFFRHLQRYCSYALHTLPASYNDKPEAVSAAVAGANAETQQGHMVNVVTDYDPSVSLFDPRSPNPRNSNGLPATSREAGSQP